ncbi:MAG: hypothetical protein LBU14_03940 [Candidatus Peribacteria bacterium]|jgi:hypothetical protein|nr:hypothetical protein [Candidatus Peribacteria bacterium]
MEENQNVNNYDENDKEFKDIQNQYVKNAFCYVPLVAFFLYFAEKKKSPEYERHLKYGMFFFVSFILLWVILGIFLSIINNWVLNFVVL